jgi:hypothetical protein
MANRRAVRVEVPTMALARYTFAPVHYADAFRIDLAENRPIGMAELAYYLFGRKASFPSYVSWLLYLRDILVKPFNIRTTSQVNPANSQGHRATFFELLQERENEIVLGEDDSHLDFRVSLLRTHEHGDQSRWHLTVTTFVRIHNLVGRIYFAAIKPFHKAIVMGTMNKALG